TGAIRGPSASGTQRSDVLQERNRGRPGPSDGCRPVGLRRMNPMKKLLALLALTTMMTGAALAQDTARIALLHGLSGSPLEAYSKQTHAGFELGLEYATGGTMKVKDIPIEL